VGLVVLVDLVVPVGQEAPVVLLGLVLHLGEVEGTIYYYLLGIL
jgi:hypothetical protein